MALPLVVGAGIALYFVNKFMPSTARTSRPEMSTVEKPTGTAANQSGKSFSDARYVEPSKAVEEITLDQNDNPASGLSPGALPEHDSNNNGREPVLSDEFAGNYSIAVPLIGD